MNDRLQKNWCTWPLVGIVVVGVVLRLLHFWFVVHTPWTQHHIMLEYDDFMNFEWVKTILAGDWLGRQTYHPYTSYMKMMAPLETWYQWWGGKEIFHQAPLYPYLLAGLFGACRESVSCVFLIQLLLGSLLPLIIYALATRFFDRRTGLVAASLAAIYGPFIFHEATLLRDWLLVILETLAVLSLLKAKTSQRMSHWVLAGALLGLGVLTRESVLVLTFLAVGWVILDGGGTRTERARAALCVIIGIMLALSPLVFRNLMVGAPPFAISNRFAEAVVSSNSGRVVEESLGPIMQVSQGKTGATLVALFDSFSGNAMRLLEVWLWKFKALKGAFEIPNNVSFYYGQHISPILRWLPGYAIIFPLGLAGLLISLASWRRRSLLFVYALACVTWLMIISPLSRYRLSLVPALIIFAAGMLVQAIDAVRLRNAGRAVAICGLVLASIVFQRWVLLLPEGAQTGETQFLDYWASARTYAAQKRYEEASEEMGLLLTLLGDGTRRSSWIEQCEADYVTYRVHALIARGALGEAKAMLDRGTRAWLDSFQARGFGTVYPLLNFGALYIRLDDPDTAGYLLRRMLQLSPNDADADRARRLLASIAETSDE